MTIGGESQTRTRLTQKIRAYSFDKAELRHLCKILDERVRGAADDEIAHFPQLQQSDEVFAENKGLLRKGFQLTVTATGDDGQQLSGTVESVFESPNFPESLVSLYVNSETALRAWYNYAPRSSLELYLDFSKNDLLDLSPAPSEATPNESRLTVQGLDTTWANGVYSETLALLKKRSTSFSFIHKTNIYDMLLWFVGIPFGFWLAWKLSGPIESSFLQASRFFTNAIYVFVFLVGLLLLRLVFHYGRWVLPLVEYRSPVNRAIRHRITLSVLALAVFGSFLYDAVKWIFRLLVPA